MWSHLANWLVQDGEVPELHRGARLRQVALRASCWSIEESDQVEGVRELTAETAATDPPGRYTVTGIVERVDKPNSVLLRVGSILVYVELDTFRSAGDNGAVETYSAPSRSCTVPWSRPASPASGPWVK